MNAMNAVNADLVEKLTELGRLYEIMGDEYRARAFSAAVLSIKRTDRDLRKQPPDLSGAKIPGIGKGILGHLQEYFDTGDISEIGKLKASKEFKAHQTLGRVMGAGPRVISEWMRHGIYTLADLRRAAARGDAVLTHAQKLGVLYYDDLGERIPRAEVTSIVEELLECIIMTGVIFTVAGSYRRGAASSGDIDILITSKPPIADYLQVVMKCVRGMPKYVDTVSNGPQRVTFLYHGQKCRQVDLLYIPYGSYFAALCYFTGSGAFNINMRGIAKSKGFLLNQNGLYRRTHAGNVLVPCDSEQQLFETVGIPWVPPEQRN